MHVCMQSFSRLSSCFLLHSSFFGRGFIALRSHFNFVTSTAKFTKDKRSTLFLYHHSLSMSTSFDGYIYAWNLPPQVSNDSIQANKPNDVKVSPKTIKDQSGPFNYRPLLPRLWQETGDGDDDMDTTDSGCTDQFTMVDVYLYHDVDNVKEHLYIHMDRQSNEKVTQTLKRMQISINKKLKIQQPRNNSKANDNDSSVSVWSMSTTDGSILERLDCTEMSCHELWERAKYKPLAIKVQSPERTLCLLVESCPPIITSVKTFDDFKSFVYPDIPVLIDVESLFADGIKIDWYVGDELAKSDSKCYTPTVNDIGKTISVLIRPFRLENKHDGLGCEEVYEFTTAVRERPANHILDIRTDWTQTRQDDYFRIVSYNILADQNAFDYGDSKKVARAYGSYCSPSTLDKARRMPLILHELLRYRADIVCLQEVDEIVYTRYFEPHFKNLGYQGCYQAKLNEGNREGCAMFWSLQRFEEVPLDTIDTYVLISDLFPFNDDDDNMNDKSDESESTLAIQKLLDQRKDLKDIVRNVLGHILLSICLTVKGNNSSKIYVGNTHLFFHPHGSHIRLMQMYFICQYFAKAISETPGSLILCGDFNSSLANSPGKLLMDRQVPANFRNLQVDLNRFIGNAEARNSNEDDRPIRKDDFPSISLPDSFPHLVPALVETPEFSHYIGGSEEGRFCAHLDHVLLSKEDWQPISSAPMPSIELVSRATAMPSENLPSDHVSILCDVALKNSKAE